jgi:DNA modification methylase
MALVERDTDRIVGNAGDHWLLQGDCLAELAAVPSDSVDVVCTDPPYGLNFMGSNWDSGVPGAPYWREILRVAKPGAYLTAFGGTRTYHRLACAIEDAGWEIRDCLMWCYGTGFPKSLDVSKALDKAGATDLAETFAGRGTALKPAWEPVILARKPLVGTVAQNVTHYGTGALDIDGCRVEHASSADLAASQGKNPGRSDLVQSTCYGGGRPQQSVNTQGRWPPNVLLSHGPDCTETACAPGCPVAELDKQAPKAGQAGATTWNNGKKGTAVYGDFAPAPIQARYDGLAGASRFFPRFNYYPAWEPVILARKPLVGTVAQNVTHYGTGALDIDGCRIPCQGRKNTRQQAKRSPAKAFANGGLVAHRGTEGITDLGRWPPNVLLSHGPDCTETACAPGCPVAELDQQSPRTSSEKSGAIRDTAFGLMNDGAWAPKPTDRQRYPGTGGASRFFPRFCYAAKASRKERGPDNRHPTVKPLAVIRWLLTLTAPPAELEPVVLDPFMGSGTTGVAALGLGLDFIGVELEDAHFETALRRIEDSLPP